MKTQTFKVNNKYLFEFEVTDGVYKLVDFSDEEIDFPEAFGMVIGLQLIDTDVPFSEKFAMMAGYYYPELEDLSSTQVEEVPVH